MPLTLPSEIMLQILILAVWEPQVCPNALSAPVKHKFPSGFSSACKKYHEMLMNEWFYVLILHSAEDWTHALGAHISDYVRYVYAYWFVCLLIILNLGRVLTLKEHALLTYASVKEYLDFSKIRRLHTITLDCHNDVGCSSSSGKSGQWSYKKVMPRLPRSLKSLIVLNAHGPDLQTIQQAVDQCPDLENLYLGRCTKFNRPNKCSFWQKFPNDHDSYFSIKGVEGYSVSHLSSCEPENDLSIYWYL
jgi:hypothetical protein